MGYQKIAQRNPKTSVQNNFKNFIWGKSYMQIKVFGSMRVPLRILSKFAQTYSLTSRAFWLKKSCCAPKGSKPPRKISFRLLLPEKKSNQIGKWGIKRQPNETQTGVQKKFKNFIWGKSYMQIKVFGSMRVPLRILSKFAQTYFLTSRAFFAHLSLGFVGLSFDTPFAYLNFLRE